MTSHTVGTREEWLEARLALLEAEKEHTRRGDELAQRRQALRWVRIEKDYRFDTEQGEASLAELFKGRSQLIVYHFMFGPDYEAGCPSCSAIADGFNGSVTHLANHDVMLWAVSRAPLAKLLAFRERMGWRFPWPPPATATSTSTSTSPSPRSRNGRRGSTTIIDTSRNSNGGMAATRLSALSPRWRESRPRSITATGRA
ncbi:hypothetical protein BTHI11S_05338 [Bosea thiooxidans]